MCVFVEEAESTSLMDTGEMVDKCGIEGEMNDTESMVIVESRSMMWA
jgi:hypothetical protein